MDHRTELTLTRTLETPDEKSYTVGHLALHLLHLLSDQVVDGAPCADEFRVKLTGYRESLEKNALDEVSAQICVEECEAHFKRSRVFVQGREAEISELIEVLREALLQLTGEAQQFNERLFGSSDRFKRLGQLDDIRELKKQIMSEVRELRQTVLEKQQDDEKHYSRLSRRIETLQSKLQVAREEALTDPLTKIANRAGFDRTLHRWIDQNKGFCLAMMDVDHFKPINDTHGHRVGDSVLMAAAQWVTQNLRSTDVMARFGGDEFAVMLAGANLRQAEKRLGSVLAELSNRSYIYLTGNDKHAVKFTMSCGVAEFCDGDSAESVIQRADEALYEAKKRRNRVCAKRRTLLGGLLGSSDND